MAVESMDGLNSMRAYYFTGAQFALSNVALRRIKVSRYQDLNDPYELLGVDLTEDNHRTGFLKVKEEISKTNGIICFCKSWENPLLWGHYAEKHTGICLGFDVPDDPERVLTVNYDGDLLKFPLEAEEKQHLEFMKRVLVQKFSDWRYENEVRHIIGLDHSTVESGKYFYSFSEDLVLREIILGPRCELPIDGIRNLVAAFNPPVDVIKAITSVDQYKVIKDDVASKPSANT